MGKIIGLTFEDTPKVDCPFCGKSYKSAEALAKHIVEKHPEESENQTNGTDE